MGDLIQLDPGYKVEGNYTVVKKLGEGAFGAVYKVTDKSNALYALKVEGVAEQIQLLKMEVFVLAELRKAGGRHFCKIEDKGQIENFNYVVMTFVGESLADLRMRAPGKKFSLGTAMSVAIQSLEALEDLHGIGYLHRDVKPANYTIGRAEINELRKVYVLDFGMARKFVHDDGTIKKPRDVAGFRGTVKYAPVACHAQRELCRLDDCETWLYMVAEFTKGSLPWRNMKDMHEIGMLKRRCRGGVEIKMLFGGCPREYIDVLRTIDSGKFFDEPKYGQMYNLLRQGMKTLNAQEFPYDWERWLEEEKKRKEAEKNKKDGKDGGKDDKKDKKDDKKDERRKRRRIKIRKRRIRRTIRRRRRRTKRRTKRTTKTTTRIIAFSRGFIPQTYQLLCRDESASSKKFCETYTEIMSNLRQIFRSANRQALTNVLVVIGCNYFTPNEVFNIDVAPCGNHEHELKVDEDVTISCAQNCGELSQRERRRIYTSLILDQEDKAHKISRNSKIYIMINAKRKLTKLSDRLEFDQDFEPPSSEGIRKRHGQTTHIGTVSSCSEERGNEKENGSYCVSLCCERDYSDYDNNDVHEQIADCKDQDNLFDCVAALNVRPANLLINFGLSVGYINKNGNDNEIDAEAHDVYSNCTKNLLHQMPHHFRSKLLTILNVNAYDKNCWPKGEVCEMNRKFLYPFVCLARQKCSAYFTEAFYTLTYAHQMLHLETNSKLNCPDGESDPFDDLFEPNHSFLLDGILSNRFCQNIPNPPRLMLKQSYNNNVKITVGVDFHWP
ncbi:unnamed protein product [Bursaphelenchus okinawaensis]|uniref:non-specific serine/threonine protein kinase n=1 Tax=Bursaphelenchus okinawaensis TaxID=465554 RepID=A0A811JUR6_9BILA|nr:unnamed protein product [Bursaphelenchus okinawaensis]CAG9084172.1 unnamed protein product [Bursaphelenchus okinawaensis]